jgi:hypothetical protein
MAKKDGKKVADVFNHALKAFLNGDFNSEGDKDNISKKSRNVFILKNNGEISLSKRDIIGLRKEVGKFTIENSGRLTFEKDFDVEALNYIDKIIIQDGIVEVPKNLFPNVLIKSEIYGKIEKY